MGTKRQSMISKFLSQLSNYYSLENDLSNIVVALCNSNPAFREKFIKFFFPKMDLNTIESITREVPDNNNLGSRVDIYIAMNNDTKPYIIEVKKGDRNHHFGQYEEAYGIERDRFGYITNYDCVEGKKLGYDVKTWEEFYNFISESEDDFVKGFLAYLKIVCGIIKYEHPMDITGLNAIPCFIDASKKIIEEGNGIAKTQFYKTFIYRSSLQVGFIFKYAEEASLDGAAYIGLWFNEKPIITIVINSRSWLSEKIIQHKDDIFKKSIYAKKAYKDYYWSKDDVWFDLSDKKLEDFINANSFDEQVNILREFMHEVLVNLEPFFE